jgi:hypothetical protein
VAQRSALSVVVARCHATPARCQIGTVSEVSLGVCRHDVTGGGGGAAAVDFEMSKLPEMVYQLHWALGGTSP